MTEPKQSFRYELTAKLFEQAFADLERLSGTEQRHLRIAVGRRFLQKSSRIEAAEPVEVSTSHFRADLPLTQVRDQTFANQTVEVDGKEFVDCTFDSVTFKFEGEAPFRFTTVHFEHASKLAVASDNPAIQAAIELTVAVIKLVNAPNSRGTADK
jgi:hypothetical protein